MNDSHLPAPPKGQAQTVFQKVTGEVLAQRIEALALEIRGIGNAEDITLASTDTLSTLAVTLRVVLKKIDEIFEFDGFVFTPACILLLELFQARARGSVVSSLALCQPLNCSSDVGLRWIEILERMNLVEKLKSRNEEPKVTLTEKGYLRTAQALQLLL